MPDPTQKFPNAFAHPETELKVDHVKDSTSLKVKFCPIGVAITGPTCQVRVGGTLYDVTDLGAYPYEDWVVVPGVENTDDSDYSEGTPLYVVLTGAAIRKILAATIITRGDLTGLWPDSIPLDEVSLEELGNRDHGFLTAVDPNQHHYQFHRHDDPADSTELHPTRLSASDVFEYRGVQTVPQITSNLDNWFPDAYTEKTVWLLSADAPRTITGLSIGPYAGRVLRWFNTGSQAITLAHNSGSSSFHNKFICTTNANIVLAQNNGAELMYDDSQWRVWPL